MPKRKHTRFVDCRADPAKLVTQAMIDKFFAKRPRVTLQSVTQGKSAACQHNTHQDTESAAA
jgi:hypothetical protein